MADADVHEDGIDLNEESAEGSDEGSDEESDEESDPNEEVKLWRGAEIDLTLIFPPFPTPGAGAAVRAPHDPVRARRFVEELSTVAEVLEQLPDRPVDDIPAPEVRADLDCVAVGCWGNVVCFLDPALGSDMLSPAMEEEIARQRERYPEARIVGSVELDYGNSYLEDHVVLPSGEQLFVGGWDCDGDDAWTYAGDPGEILRAIGVDRETAAGAGFDLDEEPRERSWSALGALVVGRFVYTGEEPTVSYFRVRRTEDGAYSRDEVWFSR
ncbi:DUF6333 family protein [Streptomyces sp. NPDC058000]|uniref:DUF6333 family protein n=1 Tax=Streptomyces sp. NPDC058000 TaxID=3346299 RepID=UPI0036E35206